MSSSPSKRQFAHWDPQMMSRGSSSNPMIPSNSASVALAPTVYQEHMVPASPENWGSVVFH